MGVRVEVGMVVELAGLGWVRWDEVGEMKVRDVDEDPTQMAFLSYFLSL